MVRIILPVLVLVLLTACTSPLEKTYRKSSLPEDLTTLRESEAVDSAGMVLLHRYFFAENLPEKVWEGKSYAAILQEARNYYRKRQQEEMKQKEAVSEKHRKAAVHRQKLMQAVRVDLYEKGYRKIDWQEFITYRFTFHNLSGKNIRAVKGSILFTDLFDQKLDSLDITCDRAIPAGGTVLWDTRRDYNRFMEKDVELLNKSATDIKILWKPEKIIFTDNSTL